jgi:hypothetical protein
MITKFNTSVGTSAKSGDSMNTIIMVVVALAVGYFAYNYFFKKKEEEKKD